MTVTDKFCEFYFKRPIEDVCAAFNEFIEEHGSEDVSFEDFRDCINTIDTLSNIDEEIMKKFKNYMEVKNYGKE